METYITNYEGLAALCGFELIDADLISTGQIAIRFIESGRTTFEEFAKYANYGTCYWHNGRNLCKIQLKNGESGIIYQDSDDQIILI